MSIEKCNLDPEIEMLNCLNLESPRSFFLFAGAGSGKTRSLVEVLKKFNTENCHHLKTSGQKIAIITYTNAACDEIKRRLEYDSSFSISTIHSFAWELIKPYQKDIKKWIEEKTNEDLIKLKDEQSKARSLSSKTAIARAQQIESKTNRLSRLNEIKKFIYNPNGNNDDKDSISHSQVIKMTADFITLKPLMQSILIDEFPILLIDESQDTKKELIDAFFAVQSKHKDKFLLGLFGDMMQRIYSDGKSDLGENLPDDWARPQKIINYRCPKRIIKLINKIRADIDNQKQIPAVTNNEGIIRLFIIDENSQKGKMEIEMNICQKMSELTNDNLWKTISSVKVLTLEHHMAASRGGFHDFFAPLYLIDKYRTGLLDGTLPEISFLLLQVLPLIKAKQTNNEFEVAQIIKKYSPLLNPKYLKDSIDPISELKKANDAVNELYQLWDNDNVPKLFDIIRSIKETKIFNIPESLLPIIAAFDRKMEEDDLINNDADEYLNQNLNAWENALNCTYNQFEAYQNYISDQSPFSTHQGVKGLEFPRVMVILDDTDARGFMFSYDKLLGAREQSQSDLVNIKEGKETSIDRTRRLFYVTCSRAKESLAVVVYSINPESVKNHVIIQGWFDENEIIELS